MNKYLYLVKNLRAIYIPIDDQEDDKKIISRLKKYYRYRIVGIPVWCCISENNICKDYKEKPFFILDQFAELQTVLNYLTENIWLRNMVVSSYYVVPIVSGLRQFDNIKNFIEPTVEYKYFGFIEDREIKFNIRLGDYAMTDFLNDLIPITREKLSDNSLSFEAIMDFRASKIKEDFNKRYWRLIDASEGGGELKLSILYVDVLKSLIASGVDINVINKFPFLFNVSIIILF